MTLQDFIEQFDKDGAVVLLEGKRKVLEGDAEKLTALGKLLTTQTKKMIFRSGNADGADHYNEAYETISIDEVDLANEPDVVYQSKSNKKTQKLIDPYVSGDLNRFTIKAAYIIRDTVKAIGTKSIKPTTFGIFYDNLEKPMTGGTGHTMNVCKQNNIPFIDQTTWFTWLTQ
jgi:hypothetical protein